MIERVGKTAYRLDLRGRFKDAYNIFHVSQLRKHIPGGSSTNPPEPIQVEGKEYAKVEACYNTGAEAILGSILLDGWATVLSMMNGFIRGAVR